MINVKAARGGDSKLKGPLRMLGSKIAELRWVTVLAAIVMAVSITPAVLAQDSTPGSESEVTTQLPSADLPSMNQQGFIYELDSTWDGSFDQVPTEAPVYRMDVPTYDADSFGAFASRLGIEGEVQDQGDGSWEVSGESGSLYSAPGFSQYISSEEIPDGDLPSDEQATAYAREWLRQTGTLPADAGEGMVVARVEDPARVILSIQPVRPENLISAYPNITITLGPNAIVLEASFRWYDLAVADTYALSSVENAWAEVSERRSFLQSDIPVEVAEPGSTVRGRATYTSVVVAYTTSGVVGETQYLQPVYVFTGTVQIEGADQTYPIRAYVPALVNSQQPVG
jgi:hypothetical protein